jgi:hypothetical protein
MKNKQLMILLLFFLSFGCKTDKETIKLDNFLKSFNLNIKDYKVICIVPIDGCGSCIDPSLKYAKTDHENFLLVMSSIYKKSIDYTIEKLDIKNANFISDFHNLAPKSGLTTEIAPYFYFLKDGKVVREVDLSKIPDKKSILKEVEKYLSE